MVDLALDGSVTAAVEITDRVEGKVRQALSVQQEASPYDVDAANELLYQAMLEDEAKKVQ